MLDPQLLRRDLETVKRGLDARGATFDEATYQSLESERRRVIQEAELVKAARNKAAEEVGRLSQIIKGAELGRDRIGAGAAGSLIRENEKLKSDLINQQREDGDKLKALEQAEREADTAFRAFVATIPNLPDASVPIGASDENNVVIKRWGQLPVIATPMDHVDLGTRLGILDLDRAAKLSGARFSVLMGWGAKLERALAAFMLDRQSANGYLEVIPPYLVNAESLYGTGQLPKFEADLFKMPHGESSLYLIPTAEVPVTNLYRDEVLAFDQLPLRHCALTPCFRSEAGSHGRDTKGLIRQHQFHKVELVSFAAPEQAEAELEILTGNAEAILEELELPYRRVLLCTGDMGFSSRKTYDLEVWLPSQDTYREISSCSWFGDFQARRANLKYKPADAKAKAAFLHTLNGSGLAVGRTWVAVLENGQQADGSVKIPKALVPYLGTDNIR